MFTTMVKGIEYQTINLAGAACYFESISESLWSMTLLMYMSLSMSYTAARRRDFFSLLHSAARCHGLLC